MRDRFGPPLPRAFFTRTAAQVASALLGATLVHHFGVKTSAGVIVETEAYVGAHDLACHASKGLTQRTRGMFGEAGHAYVYLIYGMHHCFNVVTDVPGIGAAVLVRALRPIAGCEVDADGPDKLCRALSIERALDGVDLCAPRAALSIRRGETMEPARISTGPRIGVAYAGEWADAPLRFWIADDPWVSRASAATRRLRRSAT